MPGGSTESRNLVKSRSRPSAYLHTSLTVIYLGMLISPRQLITSSSSPVALAPQFIPFKPPSTEYTEVLIQRTNYIVASSFPIEDPDA